MGENPLDTLTGCSPPLSPEAAALERRTVLRRVRREVFARVLSQVVWSLSASAVVFLPDIFSTDITEPADFTNGHPVGR
jgi:hypothetical protein